ncbi:MAG TPA: hypothetical protein PKD70_03225 [Saprospiraceae bacterium]|nr:hypothetical protein [Saprospiraceae bacterium]HMP12866.1 hypothetical protein [Saprospiraceae bacterium]
MMHNMLDTIEFMALFSYFVTNQAGDLLQFNQIRLEIIHTHALILSVWAIANILIGAYYTVHLEVGERQAFHHMNAAWNLINLGIAWLMLYQVNTADPAQYGWLLSVSKHYQTQKLMLLNIGLDVSYTLAGLLLHEHSRHHPVHSALLCGFGRSLMLQGGFLLVLDICFYNAYLTQNETLRLLLSQIV